MQKCQQVGEPTQGAEKNEEDEAFDDDEEPNIIMKKIGPAAGLLCSMMDTINDKVIPEVMESWEPHFKFQTKNMVTSFYASYNEWYPLAEKQFSK
jgi:hypothetical protein